MLVSIGLEICSALVKMLHLRTLSKISVTLGDRYIGSSSQVSNSNSKYYLLTRFIRLKEKF